MGLTNASRFLLVGWTVRKGNIRAVTAFLPTQTSRVVPRFATEREAEEADWWYQNRKVPDKEPLAAVRRGKAQILTKEKLLAWIEASKKKPAPVVAFAKSRRRSGFGPQAG